MTRPISIDNAEHYNWGFKGDNCDGWHLVKSAALSVIQERVPSGACEQVHKESERGQILTSYINKAKGANLDFRHHTSVDLQSIINRI